MVDTRGLIQNIDFSYLICFISIFFSVADDLTTGVRGKQFFTKYEGVSCKS